MAWGAVGNIRGPQGLQGFAGVGIQSAALNQLGELVLTYTDTTTVNLGRIVGIDGKDGTSVTITGSVANAAALPTGLGTADKGKGYITQDDGHLHVWDGTQFIDVGNITGPPGPAGAEGPQGIRGTAWYTGSGAPGDIPGSRAGDLYLDVDNGNVYVLS